MTLEEAKALYDSNFWEEMEPSDRAMWQLHEERLCMPFDVFQKATETLLGRPVWTHEFANHLSLIEEALGDKPAPSITEIIELLPEERRILVVKP